MSRTRTDRPAPSRVTSNVAWVVGWRLSTRVLGFASTFVLIRLLTPADFGLIMLATTFTAAVDALSAVGIQDAIVREASPNRSLYDTAFTMNALRSLATATFIATAALPAAAFFTEPRLTGVLTALALVTVAGGAENIRVVDFRRDLAFHQEFKLLLLPRIAAIAASITVAAVWHSYWALVAGFTTNRLLQLLLGYVLRPYRPRPCLGEWRLIIGFSIWTWFSSLTILLRDRSDNVVIGRVLGSAQVGLFSVGAELAALPTTELVEPLCRVLFPSFVAARNAGGNLAEVFFQAIAVTSLITMPAGVGISIVAAPMIALVFGPRWEGAVPVVSILAIAGALKVVAAISGTLFTATGLLSANFRIVVVSTAVRVGLLVALVPRIGLLGGAVAILVSVALEELLFLAMSARKLGFPMLELPRRAGRGLTATAVMAVTLSLTGLGWSSSPALADSPAERLLMTVSLGVAVYVGTLAAIWHLAGRPEGAELQVLRVIARSARRLSALSRRRRVSRVR